MFSSPDIQGINAPPWLAVIHAVNDVRPGTFLEPLSVGTQPDGIYVEEYPEARVVFPPEDGRFTPDARVEVIGKTEAVTLAIEDAAKRLGFTD